MENGLVCYEMRSGGVVIERNMFTYIEAARWSLTCLTKNMMSLSSRTNMREITEYIYMSSYLYSNLNHREQAMWFPFGLFPIS